MQLERAATLPYAKTVLEPVISAKTVEFHFGRHHLGYIKKLEALIAGTVFQHHPLEEIIRETRLSCENCTIFNNAAQAWNHAFFWRSLAPYDCGGRPSDALMKEIVQDFGSFTAFKAMALSTAAKRFGSGWLWLIKSGGRLSVYTTPNAETPAADCDFRPLLTIDLWEHAYYLDWQDRRGDFIEAVFDHLIDWNAVSSRYEACAR